MSVERKNNVVATQFRNIGNQFYNKRNLFEALLNYNHSLCFAEIGTDAVGIGYANRCATYMEMHQYSLALQDIHLARQFNYPEEKLEKLREREKTCTREIENWTPKKYDHPLDFFKLSYDAKKKYPGIVDCLALRNNTQFGNHVVTTKALKTGDVIAIEDPIFTSANEDARLYRCSYCFKDNFLKLFPCTFCTKAMFCSESCQHKALGEMHQFECNVASTTGMKINFHVKLLLRCLNVFDYNVPELQRFVKAHQKPVTVFDFDMSKLEEPMFSKNSILMILSVQNSATHCKHLADAMAEETRAFINKHPRLRMLWDDHKSFLNEMLQRVMFPVTLLTNMSAFFSKEINISPTLEDKPTSSGNQMFEQNCGQGIYPAYSLLNTCCDPNIFAVSVGKKLAWIVSRPIPAGSQLFCKYDQPFYSFGPASRRQAIFDNSYGFVCTCDACRNDWPTLPQLTAIDPSFQYNQTLSTHEEAEKNIKKNNEYIEKNYNPNRPTKEVFSSIEYNMQEFALLAKPAWYKL